MSLLPTPPSAPRSALSAASHAPFFAAVAADATVREQAPLQLCTFLLGDSSFGVDILDVQEIATPPAITPLYHASSHVAGVVNIRGQIVLCLALRSIFGLPPTEMTAESRLILFKKSIGPDFGILVDCIGDIIEVAPGKIEQHRRVPDAPLAASRVVKGICVQDDGLQLIIDARSLLPEFDMERTPESDG